VVPFRCLALAPPSCVALRRRPETNGHDGHGGALLLVGRDEDGGAAGGLGGAQVRPLMRLSAEQVTRDGTGFKQVLGDLALALMTETP
jgi:hypothetical protein